MRGTSELAQLGEISKAMADYGRTTGDAMRASGSPPRYDDSAYQEFAREMHGRSRVNTGMLTASGALLGGLTPAVFNPYASGRAAGAGAGVGALAAGAYGYHKHRKVKRDLADPNTRRGYEKYVRLHQKLDALGDD